MNRRRWRDFLVERGRGRWLAAIAGVALAPKCLLCLAAYAGLGAAGFGTRELCGGREPVWQAWLTTGALLSVTTGAGALAWFSLGRAARERLPGSKRCHESRLSRAGLP